MRQNGVSGRLLKLFQNYFYNRKQRVVLNGFPADYTTIYKLITLLSNLVSLKALFFIPLFLIYINDLERNIKFFGDNTNRFSPNKRPLDVWGEGLRCWTFFCTKEILIWGEGGGGGFLPPSPSYLPKYFICELSVLLPTAKT